MSYLIEFRFPEVDRSIWAGMSEGAFGWAWSPVTALVFESEEAAGRVLANAYGRSAEHGFIVEQEEITV